MKILCTGGLGHLGSALCYRLAKDGSQITILDSLLTQRYATLFSFPKENPIRFIEGDIRTYDMPSICEDMDVVIHLAALTDAPSTVGREHETYEINYIGALQVFEAARDARSFFVMPSTTSVYGVSEGEVDETCTDLRPQSPYASSKLEAERYILTRNYNKAVVLRLGTIYGISMGMRWHTFVNRACWQAALGQPITIWNTAMHQKRPYLYLGDFVSAVHHVIEKKLNGLYNVVSQNSTPFDIVSILKKHCPDLKVQLTTSRLMNLLSYDVSSAKLQATGWTPKGDLATGIAQTMALLGGVKG